eukprot:XP_017944863.1 PREDICTED: vomeronasal type-2 receptor 26-like [Xenopus tropicalis]
MICEGHLPLGTMLVLTVLLQIFPAASDITHYSTSGCVLWKNNYINTFRDGDFILGAVLQLSDFHWSFWPPEIGPLKDIFCIRTSFKYCHHLLVFKFAIEEINKSLWILPNVTLGYQIFDSCASSPKALSGALDIISGANYKIPNNACLRNMKLIGVLGDLSSRSSYPIAQLAGLFRYPQVSYGATEPVYNDRIQFPSFYRTVPNELSEMDGIVQILKHFGWKWVGLILSENDSGERALDRIRKVVGFLKTNTSVPVQKSSGNESLVDEVLSRFGNFDFRVGYQVYTAVYALAHSLHNLFSARAPAHPQAPAGSLKHRFKPWQLNAFFHNVTYKNPSGDIMFFKANGDPPARFDIVKWLFLNDGSTVSRKVGSFDESNEENQLYINSSADWWSPYFSEIPAGVSQSLLNEKIFVKYWDTPIVRANNQHLSCLLLISLMLCFLCTLLFIGRPIQICCLLRQVTFGIVFTVSVSSVLAKTLTVIIAFNATKPGSKLKKYVGTQLSIILVIVCSLVEFLISAVWLAYNPPFPEADTVSDPDYIILLCNEGSELFFFCIIGYIGTLALLSFIAAFLAKDFPDRFNEAKNITFSMLGFCSVWGAFVPAYLSSKGSRMVAVEIFAILSSSAGLLGCIFAPKCYIIFLRPELNIREIVVRKS